MANYAQDGNRWTAIYIIRYSRGETTYQKLPFELVRFNVDTNPSAEPEIVPDGNPGYDANREENRIYERVWIVDQVPFGLKVNFGKVE